MQNPTIEQGRMRSQESGTKGSLREPLGILAPGIVEGSETVPGDFGSDLDEHRDNFRDFDEEHL